VDEFFGMDIIMDITWISREEVMWVTLLRRHLGEPWPSLTTEWFQFQMMPF